MSIERPSAGVLDQAGDEQDDESSYSAHFHIESSEEKVLEARERKARHVYETFVEPVLEEGQEFTVEDISSQIRPPYDSSEIRDALDYGVREDDLEYGDGSETFFSF